MNEESLINIGGTNYELINAFRIDDNSKKYLIIKKTGEINSEDSKIKIFISEFVEENPGTYKLVGLAKDSYFDTFNSALNAILNGNNSITLYSEKSNILKGNITKSEGMTVAAFNVSSDDLNHLKSQEIFKKEENIETYNALDVLKQKGSDEEERDETSDLKKIDENVQSNSISLENPLNNTVSQVEENSTTKMFTGELYNNNDVIEENPVSVESSKEMNSLFSSKEDDNNTPEVQIEEDKPNIDFELQMPIMSEPQAIEPEKANSELFESKSSDLMPAIDAAQEKENITIEDSTSSLIPNIEPQKEIPSIESIEKTHDLNVNSNSQSESNVQQTNTDNIIPFKEAILNKQNSDSQSESSVQQINNVKILSFEEKKQSLLKKLEETKNKIEETQNEINAFFDELNNKIDSQKDAEKNDSISSEEELKNSDSIVNDAFSQIDNIPVLPNLTNDPTTLNLAA